jgi:archaetidylinositol phosphate synthase
MKRINATFTTIPEEKFLDYITPKLPLWCTPDFLTLMALASTMLTTIFYMLYAISPLFLLAVNLCMVINWFTDATDGRAARVRGISRPNYGYYVDHICDSLGLVFITLGVALSGMILTPSWVVGGFLMLMVYIHTYLKTTAFQEFDPSLNGFGPTEARLLLIAVNLLIFCFGNSVSVFAGISMTTFDYIGWIMSAVTLVVLVTNILKTTVVLYNRERV